MITETEPESQPPARQDRKWPWWRPWWRRGRIYFLRQFPRRKRLHGTFIHRLLGNRLFDPGLWIPNRESVARGLAVGIFMGMMPFFGAQILVSLVLCFLLRVNVSAAVIATFVSNPLTAGGLLWAQVQVGQWLTDPMEPAELANYAGPLKFVVTYAKPLMIGSLVTAVAGAVIAYPLTLLLWNGVSKLGKTSVASRGRPAPAPRAEAPEQGIRTRPHTPQ